MTFEADFLPGLSTSSVPEDFIGLLHTVWVLGSVILTVLDLALSLAAGKLG